MLLLFGLLLLVFGAGLMLLMPALWGSGIHHHYAQPRAVICPETRREAGVTLDAVHAAATGINGKPAFRLSDCTRWPARVHCSRECLPQALENEPYTKGEAHLQVPRGHIYHLPVLLGAFAAWYVGMVWHSRYLFRDRWMAALGLSESQWRQLVLWYSPHLLSVAACLLFAYGVAWLQTWLKHMGIWQGILSSTVLWAVIALAALPSMLGLSRELLLIEAGYTFVAMLIVGGIVGGLSGKLVLTEVK